MDFEGFNMWTMILFTLRDWGYWVQIVSASLFTYLVLTDQSIEKKTPWKAPLKILFISVLFVAIHVSLMLPSFRFRFLAGMGAWFAYGLGVTVYTALFSSYDKNARFVVCALSISTIVLVNEFGAVFGMLLEQAIPGFVSAYMRTAADVLLVFAAWFVVGHPVWKYYLSDPAAFMGIFINGLSAVAVVIYDMFRVNLFGPEEDVYTMMLMTIMMLTLYLINTVCYQMIYNLSLEQTQVLELQANTQMDKSASSLLSVTDSNLNELHKIKHDIQNQYAYMRMLLRNKSYDALGEYFTELTESFSEPLVPFVDCGNRVLDLILNMENAKAQELGIELDIKAAPPHTLPFRDVDLCNLYTNLIDNALEACASEKLPDAAVHITVNVRGDYLFTQIMNPTKKDKSFLEKGLATTKTDRRLHGKGMSIVRGIVKKYNGQYNARIEKGRYYAEFLLDLTHSEEGENE